MFIVNIQHSPDEVTKRHAYCNMVHSSEHILSCHNNKFVTFLRCPFVGNYRGQFTQLQNVVVGASAKLNRQHYFPSNFRFHRLLCDRCRSTRSIPLQMMPCTCNVPYLNIDHLISMNKNDRKWTNMWYTSDEFGNSAHFSFKLLYLNAFLVERKLITNRFDVCICCVRATGHTFPSSLTNKFSPTRHSFFCFPSSISLSTSIGRL